MELLCCFLVLVSCSPPAVRLNSVAGVFQVHNLNRRGLHDQGWTREQAIAVLREKEARTEESARRAIERYMAWPGQALAYKVGELRLLELRARARSRLGARFDIRRFHAVVLDAGMLPLSMLETRVDAWVAKEGA